MLKRRGRKNKIIIEQKKRIEYWWKEYRSKKSESDSFLRMYERTYEDAQRRERDNDELRKLVRKEREKNEKLLEIKRKYYTLIKTLKV